MHSRKKIIGEEHQDDLYRLYVVELKSVAEIASIYGCSVPTIRKWLKKLSILRGASAINAGLTQVWNRGLTAADDQRLQNISEVHSGTGNPMFNRPSWNKGLTKDTDSRMLVVSRKNTGNSPNLLTRTKMAIAKMGKYGPETNRWSGGRRKAAGGYVSVMTTEGYRYQHRMVAECLLRRSLVEGEDVHHMDFDKTNNFPSNLLVLTNSAHTSLHQALRQDPSLDQREWLAHNNHDFEDLIEYANRKIRKAA